MNLVGNSPAWHMCWFQPVQLWWPQKKTKISVSTSRFKESGVEGMRIIQGRFGACRIGDQLVHATHMLHACQLSYAACMLYAAKPVESSTLHAAQVLSTGEPSGEILPND